LTILRFAAYNLTGLYLLNQTGEGVIIKASTGEAGTLLLKAHTLIRKGLLGGA
jgi:hypothetical protein